MTDQGSIFPHPSLADEEGFLVATNEMNVEMLLDAYSHGIFPWPVEGLSAMLWWSPHERAVFDLENFHVPKRLRQTVRGTKFKVTSNQAFRKTIRFCAKIPRGPFRDRGTWITDDIIREYCKLHEMNIAHSVEVWQGAWLVGGLYGVAIGSFFAGESMFHLSRDASKVALVCAARHLRRQGYTLFDIQMTNPHLEQFRVTVLPQKEYLRRLQSAIHTPCDFGEITENHRFEE